MRKIGCGSDHCMALMDLGVLTVWGDNEFGQIGNKKRSFSQNPLIVSQLKDKIINDFFIGNNQNLVIVEKQP